MFSDIVLGIKIRVKAQAKETRIYKTCSKASVSQSPHAISCL